MQLVFIEDAYIDYLRKADERVCFNKGGKRPYVGVVFEVLGHKYFAPLTSHGKGKLLKENPKPEDITFLPINDCRHGGINFNNMIPLVVDVYKLVDMEIKAADTIKQKTYKGLLKIQWYFISRHKKEILQKAKLLYNLKTKGHLLYSAQRRTVDFLKLEKVAEKYKPTVETP